MKIQEIFDHFLNTVKNSLTVALVDGEGEIILYSFKENEITDEDVRLFAAHIVHTMAKKINEKPTDEIFIYDKNHAAFAKRLKDDLVVLIIFGGESYQGYARMKAEDLIKEVEKEFF